MVTWTSCRCWALSTQHFMYPLLGGQCICVPSARWHCLEDSTKELIFLLSFQQHYLAAGDIRECAWHHASSAPLNVLSSCNNISGMPFLRLLGCRGALCTLQRVAKIKKHQA